jgi:hypothetical protein
VTHCEANKSSGSSPGTVGSGFARSGSSPGFKNGRRFGSRLPAFYDSTPLSLQSRKFSSITRPCIGVSARRTREFYKRPSVAPMEKRGSMRIFGGFFLSKVQQKGFTTLAQKRRTPEEKLIVQALDEFLIRNGISTRPEDPELAELISTFSASAKVDRDKFIADLRNYSEDRFRGEYPLVASGPTVLARLRSYAKEGGR